MRNPQRTYDAVLFDLDGTLVDTAPDIGDALNACLTEAGRPPVEEAWVRNRIGHGTRSLLAAAAASGMSVDAMTDRFYRHYAAHCGRRGRLYPHASRILSLLRDAGIGVGLLTNKEQSFADFVLHVHGIGDAFDAKVYGDTLIAKKPDALVAKHLVAQLHADRKRTLLVGDSAVDVQTARNADIAVWGVDYGYNHGNPISESLPDHVIGSLEELESLVAYSEPRASSSSPYLRNRPRN